MSSFPTVLIHSTTMWLTAKARCFNVYFVNLCMHSAIYYLIFMYIPNCMCIMQMCVGTCIPLELILRIICMSACAICMFI